MLIYYFLCFALVGRCSFEFDFCFKYRRKGDILNGELKGALCQIRFPCDKERPYKYRFDKKNSFKYYFEQCIFCMDLWLGSLIRPYLRNLKTRKST